MKLIDKIALIGDYLNQFEGIQKEKIQEFYLLIKTNFPHLKEKMAWRMPTFYDRKIILSFAAHKHHLGLSPGPEVISHYQNRLENYTITKGSIHVEYDQRIDKDLIFDIVKYNIEHQGVK